MNPTLSNAKRTAAPAPRALLLSSEFPPGPGGIGAHAYQLAAHLGQRGWALHVAAPQEYAAEATRAAFNQGLDFGITPLAGGRRGPRQAAARGGAILAALRQARPQVIIGSGQRALWTAAVLARLTGIPYLAIGHGSEFLQPSPLARLLTRWAVRQARALVAVSDYTAALIRRQAPPRRLVVIPNGADETRFRPGLETAELRAALDLGAAQVLLTVGHVTERKAQDVVIRALAQVRRQREVVYVMVGLPTRRAEFMQVAQAAGVAEQVRFTGVVDAQALPLYYNLCDLFVLVSRQSRVGDVEGYGIAALEAALCGKTAVVSRGCGLEEAVVDGVTGLTAPPDDVDATAAAIGRLLDDAALRRRLAEAARRRAQQATWAQRIAAYDSLLRGWVEAAP